MISAACPAISDAQAGATFVLPAGPIPPNPLELLERPAFGLLMRELISKFDHVVVDTPAAEQGADPCVVAARCGAALVLGASLPNPFTDAILTGKAHYTMDIAIEGMLHLKVLRSPHAHARIRGIDRTKALAVPGVSLLLYGKSDPRPGRKMGHLTAVADSVEEAAAKVLEARERACRSP